MTPLLLLLIALPVSTEAPKSLSEHFDVLWLITVVAFGIIVFFAARTLKKIDNNQTELFNRMHTVETDLSYLRGEHANMCNRMVSVLQTLEARLFSGGKSDGRVI